MYIHTYIHIYIHIYTYIHTYIYIYTGAITSSQYIKKNGSLEILFIQFKQKLMIDKAKAYLAGIKKGTCIYIYLCVYANR
jgi:hypothetical protein